MKAVIYARYSSDNQREESIEGQIRECTTYAEKNSITVLKHYIDRAMSAKTDDRPDFQQMIKDSEKGLFDLIHYAGQLAGHVQRCENVHAHASVNGSHEDVALHVAVGKVALVEVPGDLLHIRVRRGFARHGQQPAYVC